MPEWGGTEEGITVFQKHHRHQVKLVPVAYVTVPQNQRGKEDPN